MLLDDMSKTPNMLEKINKHLHNNYGLKISETKDYDSIVSTMESINDEINNLKNNGNDSSGSPEITKRLLILEGLKILKEYAELDFKSPQLDHVINSMVNFVVDHFTYSGVSMADFEEAVKDAMKVYRSSKYRFPDELIEHSVRDRSMVVLNIKNPTVNTGVFA